MFTCSNCGAREGREEFVDEVFRIDGRYVLVDQIPASPDFSPRGLREAASYAINVV